ncbi:TonB-dependent receptor [Herbaspirillum sp. WKF16]|uniref:TonB-dependent siderophore receptor n=1 Tax=Herbaspirillum sp. WKF16 TaxID=3028312 RepID=UPI0023A93CF8|nr:TonB-dependent receptor [Herbaspirillum sp. WKF16]WDZ95822.1 TonB-dependent receptor [Herbaspirillum sp. WKF16]
MHRGTSRARQQARANLKIKRKAGVLLVALAITQSFAMAQSPAVPVDIPAQRLDDALRSLARQSGRSIIFSPEATQQRQAPAIKGNLSVEDALERLLDHSGLHVQSTGAGGFTISASDKATSGTLPEVTVAGGRPSLFAAEGVNVGALGYKKPEELPFSVQSYPAQLMEAQEARTMMDVFKNDPSVQDATQAGAYEMVRIRGYFSDWTNTVRRDGMSVAPYYEIPLENIEQIDILKGPSGFLYGINSPGGTINYAIKRPTKDRFTTVRTSLRDNGGTYLALDTGGPLDGGRFGYRFNVARERNGNFSHNGDTHRDFASGAFDWAVTSDLLVRANFDYQNRKIAAQPTIGPYLNGQLPPVSGIDPRTLLGQPWLQYETKTFNIGADVEYRINGNWKFVTRAAQSYNGRVAAFPDIYNIGADGRVLSGDIYVNPNQSFRVLSTDTYVSGNFDTAGISHQLVTGFSTRNFQAIESGFKVLTDTVGNIYNPVYTSAPGNLTYPNHNVSKNYQPSVFASDLISLNDRWDLMVGLRHVSYKNDSMPASGKNTSQTASINAPSAAVTFKVLPNLSTYLSYAEGFEQPGPAGYDTNNAGENLPPLKTKQYETGAKYGLTPDLMLTAALFRLEKTLQYVNAAKFTVQGGVQRHSGLELTANGRLTRDLSLVAGLAYLKTQADAPADPAVAGRQIPDVPKLQGNLFLDYRVPAIAGLNVNGGAYYVGRRPLTTTNSVWMGGYTRFDAGLRYATNVGGYKTTFGLTVQNLLDKHYWAAGDADINGAWTGKPRTMYLSAQVDM